MKNVPKAVGPRFDDPSNPFAARVCARTVWFAVLAVAVALGYAGWRTATSISELTAAVHLLA